MGQDEKNNTIIFKYIVYIMFTYRNIVKKQVNVQ